MHGLPTAIPSTVCYAITIYILFIGNPASTLNLEQYSVSLQSSSSFIATINITDSSLQGTWQISLPQNTFYDVLVSAISDLSFSSDLLALDPSSNYGFSSVVGKPLNGI